VATAFFVHAQIDHEFVCDVAKLLRFSCNLTCFVDGGMIGEGQDLISKAEECLCVDVLVLILSAASCPDCWARKRWEPVLFDQAQQENAEVVTVLLTECSFPELLRQRNFIDGTANLWTARRLLQRWFSSREQQSCALLTLHCSKCGHRWIPKSDRRPIICPRCNSIRWDEPCQTGEISRRLTNAILKKRGFF
jgi:hypothetical protein